MEAAEIDKRGMKDAAEEAEVKSAVAKTTAKAVNSVSSDGVFPPLLLPLTPRPRSRGLILLLVVL